MSLTLSSGNIFADCFAVMGHPPSAHVGIGNFIFSFTLRFEVKRCDPPRTLINVGGTINLNGKLISTFEPDDGPGNIESGINYDLPTTKSFRAILNRANLEEIELARRGGDLNLALQLNGLVLHSDTRTEKISTSLAYNIEQTQWLKLLDNWKFGDRIFLEVSLPTSSSEIGSAFEYFRSAQEFFKLGRWEQSVGECRKVLDNLTSERSKAAQDDRSKKERNMRSLEDRFHDLHQALINVCHPASHGDENAASIEWSKESADAVLIHTAVRLKSAKSR